MLNWTLEAVITLISGLPITIGIIILVRQYLKHKDQIFLLMSFSWSIHTVYLLNFGISYLTLIPEIIQINALVLALDLFVLIILYDYMNNLSLEPVKLVVASMLATIMVMTAFQPNAVLNDVLANGDKSFIVGGLYRIMTSIVAFYMGFIYLFYAIKIYLNVPESLRKWAIINIIGVFIFSWVIVLFFVLGVTSLVPGIATLFSALGASLSIYAFVNSPKLIYAMPFKTYKLLVIDTMPGLTLYAYEWAREEDIDELIHNDLFSSALSGLNSFAIEAIKRGNIREMRLESGLLIIRSVDEYNLKFVLITSDNSRVLRDNLENFANEFIRQYYEVLQHRDTTRTITSRFLESDDLVEKVFPYIPSYK